MRSLILMIMALFTLVAWAPCGQGPVSQPTAMWRPEQHTVVEVGSTTDRTTDTLVDKLCDRMLKLLPFPLTGLQLATRSSVVRGDPIPHKPTIAGSVTPLNYRRVKLGRQIGSARAEGATVNLAPELSGVGPTDRSIQAKQVLWMLQEGNARYVDETIERDDEQIEEILSQSAWNKEKLCLALLVMCPTVFVKASSIFQVKGDNFIRTIESFAGVAQPYDAMIGSVEYMLTQSSPPVIVVMGNSHNHAIRAAISRALKEKMGKSGSKTQPASLGPFKEDETSLVSLLLPAAMDAVRQQPHGSVRRLCELASNLNVFNTIEILFRSSKTVRERVAAGQLQVHGAFMDQRNGNVFFLGEHPNKQELISNLQDDLSDLVRTAGAGSVPSDEAYARLFAGNRRFASDRTAEHKDSLGLKRLQQLAAHGQNPLALLLGCSDSRAPTETVFDAAPGDVFVIRNAGNMCANASTGHGCGTIGSAEYAVGELGTRLLVVMGHTGCGAVTAAVQTVLEEKTNPGQAGKMSTIKNMLGNMHAAAVEAVEQVSGLEEQVQLAATLSIYDTIAKLITGSAVIGGAVTRGELEVHGCMYNISTGAVTWLGPHHSLESLVRKPMPIHRWKETPHISGQFTLDYFGGFMGHNGELIYIKEPRHKNAVWPDPVINLKKGNARFIHGEGICQENLTFEHHHHDPGAKPSTLILTGAESPATIRNVFDAAPTDLILQKTIGNIASTNARTALLASVEYAVVTFAPKLILILGQSDSEIVRLALRYVQGKVVDDEYPKSFRTILSRLSVPAARALRDVERGFLDTTAGGKSKLQRLTVELNALYYIEKLLTNSEVIRYAVRTGQLEVQAAVLNDRSLEVDFLGPHPLQDEILQSEKLQPPPSAAPEGMSVAQKVILEKKMEEEMKEKLVAVAPDIPTFIISDLRNMTPETVMT